MCPTLSNPENGQVTVTNYTVVSVATYTCNNGYTLTGAEMRMCVQNGQWTPEESTCQCKLIVLVCDHNDYCSSLPQLLTVVLSTTPQMDKSWHLLLHSTTWLPIPATVATLSMEHGQGLVKLVEFGVMQSQPVRVSKLSPIKSIALIPFLTLILLLTALCLHETLSNGMVTYSTSGDPPSVGTMATYSCDTGYDLTGDEMRTCVEGSGWTGSLPVCNSQCTMLLFSVSYIYLFNACSH